MDAHTDWSVRLLYQVALVLFIFTVVVGILNGTDAVDFGHETLMTHVHAGTLGWISLCVFGASLQLFCVGMSPDGGQATFIRNLPVVSVISITGYVAIFFVTTGIWRPIAGAVTLIVAACWFGWVLARSRSVVLSVPRLAILAALASLAIGAVLGVLLGIELSGEADVLPDGAEDAHPAAMVIGFLIPVGMALAEWILRPGANEEPANRLGKLQVALPFTGGILVMAGLLADINPLVAASLPFEIAGVAIFLWRMRSAIRDVVWRSPDYARAAVLTSLFLVVDIGLFVYLIVRYEGELDLAPQREILALDHVMFIGVMTNVLFGLVNSRIRNPLPLWVHNVIVVATNVGLVGFAIGLLADSSAIKQTFTPILGTGILLAIVAFSSRLQINKRDLGPLPSNPKESTPA